MIHDLNDSFASKADCNIMLDIVGDPALQILSYLDYESLLLATKVCKSWHHVIVHENAISWQRHFKTFYQQLKNNMTRANKRRIVDQWKIIQEFEEKGKKNQDLFHVTRFINDILEDRCHNLYCDRIVLRHWTPLHVASYHGSLDIVKILLPLI